MCIRDSLRRVSASCKSASKTCGFANKYRDVPCASTTMTCNAARGVRCWARDERVSRWWTMERGRVFARASRARAYLRVREVGSVRSHRVRLAREPRDLRPERRRPRASVAPLATAAHEPVHDAPTLAPEVVHLLARDARAPTREVATERRGVRAGEDPVPGRGLPVRGHAPARAGVRGRWTREGKAEKRRARGNGARRVVRENSLISSAAQTVSI